jgi:hypothetical protein
MNETDQSEPLPEEYAADKRIHPALLAHRWQPGQSGNPEGKHAPRYSGRIRALRELDRLLEDETHLAAIRKALSSYILKSPLRAFKTLIMPLLPKEARLELGEEGMTIVWKSLCSTDRTPDSSPSMTIDVDSGSSAPVAGGERPALPPPNSSTGPDTRRPATTDGSRPRTSSPSAVSTPARPLRPTS